MASVQDARHDIADPAVCVANAAGRVVVVGMRVPTKQGCLSTVSPTR